jgi:hypothetical protein
VLDDASFRETFAFMPRTEVPEAIRRTFRPR